ncbi:hypothetical protein GCM10010368_65950 [Streptomyces roseiscleroticus]|uniref:Transposase n=1 Tax=Streptomyces roseiscleroticus TaxID=1972 RepID=A0ABN3F4F9_9ACTN
MVRFGWVPASLRGAGTGARLTCAPQAGTAGSAALATSTAAFTSRSRTVPHAPHVRTRTFSGSGPYIAGSCGGAPLQVVKDYIAQQKRPD